MTIANFGKKDKERQREVDREGGRKGGRERRRCRECPLDMHLAVPRAPTPQQSGDPYTSCRPLHLMSTYANIRLLQL